ELHDVLHAHQLGAAGAREQVALGIEGVAEADVTEGVDHVFLGQDAVGDDDVADGALQLELHSITAPPSTTSVCPVMKALSWEARKMAAPTRSAGYWMRGSARAPMRCLRNSISSGVGLSSLSVLPGAMVFTRMPLGPSSRARQRVKPRMPALEVM